MHPTDATSLASNIMLLGGVNNPGRAWRAGEGLAGMFK